MENKLVSILMSAYNAERFIKEAVDSALAQTYKDIEVVVIDAASKDGTLKILESYDDPRLRVIRHGYEPIIATRNALLKEAKGEYLTFLDSDDIYLPEKVEEEVQYLEAHGDYSAVYCDLRYFFDGEPAKLYRHRYEFYSGELFPHLLEKMFITNTTFMFRRGIYDDLGGYDEKLGLVEDWDYFLRISYAGYKIGFLERDLVRYRLRWDSHTNFGNQVPIQQSAVNIFENLKAHMTPADRARYDIDRYVAKRRERLLVALLTAGKGKEARAIAREIRPHLSFPRRAAYEAFSFLPGSVLRFGIERAWKMKKRNLFEAV